MIDRICISINNRCNLNCRYCHFHEKGNIDAAEMDVFEILDNVKKYASNSSRSRTHTEIPTIIVQSVD